MKVLHYHNPFDFTGKTKPLHEFCSDFGESCTDTTHWRPDISIARAQAGISSGKQLLYDFPDGEDTGETVQTVLRSPSLDIVEVDTAIERVTTTIERKKKSDESKAASEKADKELSDNIKKIADNLASGSSSEPES